MKNHLTWDEVIKRTDLLGVDIQIDEGGFLLRGPISSITVENEYVYIWVSWMASIPINRRSVQLGEGWELCKRNFFSTSVKTVPTDIGNGRISIVVPHKGFAIIHSKNDERLDPTKVSGLKI